MQKKLDKHIVSSSSKKMDNIKDTSMSSNAEYQTDQKYSQEFKEKSSTDKQLSLTGNTDEKANKRYTGFGQRTWSDSSVYEGQLVDDMRHGQGIHKWINGEVYQGSFFKDHRHGFGTYTWPDGTKFTGTFYLDKKEGYGSLYLPNGDKFEGLYKENDRFGPGVFTYKKSNDYEQDIGIWHRERLLRLCTKAENVFSMKNHSDYEYFPEENHSQISLDADANIIQSVLTRESESHSCLSKKFSTALFSECNALPHGIESYSKDFQNLPKTLDRKEELDKAFFGSCYSLVKDDHLSFLVATNNTSLNVEIQKHIYKHRHSTKSVSFDVDAVVKGNRKCFDSKSGPVELASMKLIENAVHGNTHAVYSILKSGLVDPNVSDCRGNYALLEAAVQCHHDVANILLDAGTNVNQLTDEGVSSLNACHVFYYPVDHFKSNIGETYMDNYRKDQKRRSMSMTFDSSELEMFKERMKRFSNPETKKRQMSIVESRMASEIPSLRRISLASPTELSHTDLMPAEIHLAKMESTDAIETCKSDLKIKQVFQRVMSAKSRGRSSEVKSLKFDQDLDESSSEPVETEILQDDPTFKSDKNIVEYSIDITEDLIEKTATLLSMNHRAVSGVSTRDGQAIRLGTPAALAVWKAEHVRLQSMIALLLNRGANPNIGSVPLQPLFFAVKAGDVEAVRLLLQYGASTNARLSDKLGGFTPLHIAAGICCSEAVEIVQLLLHANADPNAVAHDEEVSYSIGKTGLDTKSSEKMDSYHKWLDSATQWLKDGLNVVEESGRTALHISCDRDDNYVDAQKITQILLDNGANPDVIWSGQSPLSLAIACGNDLSINELLKFKASGSLPLPRGNGNALCVASNPEHERRRSSYGRLELITKLVDSGANMLAPVTYGEKFSIGTVVDYAHYMFNQDTRIAHTPYHALSAKERETYNARRELLTHLGTLLRKAAVNVERERLNKERQYGIHSRSPSRDGRFIYTGAGAEEYLSDDQPGPGYMSDERASPSAFDANASRVSFLRENQQGPSQKRGTNRRRSTKSRKKASMKGPPGMIRKPLFRYCYECGRSVGVRLSACSRCQEVYYCSRACKLKSWEERHKEECLRIRVSVEQSPLPTTPEIAALFSERHLEETIDIANQNSSSIIDSILNSHMLIAETNTNNLANHSVYVPRASLGRWTATARSRRGHDFTRPGTKKSEKSAKSNKTKQTPDNNKRHTARASRHNTAHVSAKTRAKVGKDVEFGTTGMTLAELGITENYSYE